MKPATKALLTRPDSVIAFIFLGFMSLSVIGGMMPKEQGQSEFDKIQSNCIARNMQGYNYRCDAQHLDLKNRY